MIFQENKIIRLLCFLPAVIFFAFILSCGETTPVRDGNTVKPSSRETKAFSVLCTGDLLYNDLIVELIRCSDIKYPFERIEQEFVKHDIVFSNLEMPVTVRGTAHPYKQYTFRISQQIAAYLKKTKIDVLSLSNNHIMDYGVAGLFDTISFLREWGVAYTGAGFSLREARQPAVLRYGDTQVLFLSYCDLIPHDFFATDKTPGTAPMNMDMVIEDVKRLKTRDNLVFVSLHWGNEYEDIPLQSQQDRARRIIDAGADAIIGHHPHIPQGVEIYKQRPIIYSLGNLLNGFYEPGQVDNIMAVLHCYGPNVIGVELVPIAGRNIEMHMQPYVLEGDSAIKALDRIRKLSSRYGTDMMLVGDRMLVQGLPDPSKVRDAEEKREAERKKAEEEAVAKKAAEAEQAAKPAAQ